MKVMKILAEPEKKKFVFRGHSYATENDELTAFVKEAQKTWGLKMPDFGAALSKVLEHFGNIGWICKKSYEEVSAKAFALGASEFYRLFALGSRTFLFPELGQSI